MMKKSIATVTTFIFLALPLAQAQAANALIPKTTRNLKPPCARGQIEVGSGENARCSTRTEFRALRKDSEARRAKRLANRKRINVTRRTGKITRTRFLHATNGRSFANYKLRDGSKKHDVPMTQIEMDLRAMRALDRGLNAATTRQDWSPAGRIWTSRTRSNQANTPGKQNLSQ